MSFWSVSGPEPKRNYRWVVHFSSNLQNITYALKKVDKPKAKIGEVTHKYLNHSFYYPGRLEWEAINMTFASVTKPDATQLVNNVLLNAGYGVPSSETAPGSQVSTIGKRKFAGALGNTIDIMQLDADGLTTEKWQIHNPFFTNVQFGTLDYSSEEIVEISTTVRYDWAQLVETVEPAEPTIIIPSGPGFP
jgi:hypothetical protein